jgi:hypothetical protein
VEAETLKNSRDGASDMTDFDVNCLSWYGFMAKFHMPYGSVKLKMIVPDTALSQTSLFCHCSTA